MLKVVKWDQLSANSNSYLKKTRFATFRIMLVVSIRTSVLSWKLCAAAKYPILCLQRRSDQTNFVIYRYRYIEMHFPIINILIQYTNQMIFE